MWKSYINNRTCGKMFIRWIVDTDIHRYRFAEYRFVRFTKTVVSYKRWSCIEVRRYQYQSIQLSIRIVRQELYTKKPKHCHLNLFGIFHVIQITTALRVHSKSQNWPAGPWPDQSFRQWNRLFPRVLAENPSPWCIVFRIWLFWLDNFD